LDVGGVIEASFLETLRTDPERADPWYDFADAEATGVYDGPVPINMHVLDDVALIRLGEHDENDLEVYGLLESENPSVLSWAGSLYGASRSEADRLDVAMLPEERSGGLSARNCGPESTNKRCASRTRTETCPIRTMWTPGA
jgi:hypothetical protein